MKTWPGVALMVALCGLWGCDADPPAQTADMGQEDSGDLPDDLAQDAEPDLPQAPALVINELAAAGDPDDWFELYNPTDAPVPLEGFTFSDDPDQRGNLAAFPDGAVVPARGHLLVQFTADWPGFGLGGDEALGLFAPGGEPLDAVDWDEGASPPGASLGRIPDGEGAFKTLLTPTPGAPNQDNPGGAVCGDNVKEGDEGCDDGNLDPDDGCNPRCQPEVCGNGLREWEEECDDGDDDPNDGCDACALRFVPGPLLLNEVVAAPAMGDDWIELYNPGPDPVPLEGWSLLDDGDDPARRSFLHHQIALAPGAFLWIERGGANFSFGLGARDQVRLLRPDGQLADATAWEDGQAPPGASWGRLPDAPDTWGTLFQPSPGARNLPNLAARCDNALTEPGEACDGDDLGGLDCAARGLGDGALACAPGCAALDTAGCAPAPLGVLINELRATGDDEIELLNTAPEAISLEGWSLSDAEPWLPGHRYLFPDGAALAPGARLVLVRDQDHAFGLGPLDEVLLTDAQGALRARARWRYGEAATSFCRLPDGVGALVPCGAATFGAANAP